MDFFNGSESNGVSAVGNYIRKDVKVWCLFNTQFSFSKEQGICRKTVRKQVGKIPWIPVTKNSRLRSVFKLKENKTKKNRTEDHSGLKRRLTRLVLHVNFIWVPCHTAKESEYGWRNKQKALI